MLAAELMLGFERYWNPNISLQKIVVVFIKYQAAPIQSNNDARFEACAFFNQIRNIALKHNNNQRFGCNIIPHKSNCDKNVIEILQEMDAHN